VTSVGSGVMSKMGLRKRLFSALSGFVAFSTITMLCQNSSEISSMMGVTPGYSFAGSTLSACDADGGSSCSGVVASFSGLSGGCFRLVPWL
jgi:hypothetical protein